MVEKKKKKNTEATRIQKLKLKQNVRGGWGNRREKILGKISKIKIPTRSKLTLYHTHLNSISINFNHLATPDRKNNKKKNLQLLA